MFNCDSVLLDSFGSGCKSDNISEPYQQNQYGAMSLMGGRGHAYAGIEFAASGPFATL
jgi:hypothetical protein